MATLLDNFNSDANDLLDLTGTFDLAVGSQLEVVSEHGVSITTKTKLDQGHLQTSLISKYPFAELGSIEATLSPLNNFAFLFTCSSLPKVRGLNLSSVQVETCNDDESGQSLSLNLLNNTNRYSAKVDVKFSNPDFFQLNMGSVSYTTLLSFVYKDFTFGLRGDIKDDNSFSGDVGLWYKTLNRSISLRTTQKFHGVGFIYSHQFRQNLLGVSSVEVSSSSLEQVDLETRVAFGFENQLSTSETIKGLVQIQNGKQSSANIALRYSSRLHGHARISYALILDALNFAGGAHKAGIKLDIGGIN